MSKTVDYAAKIKRLKIRHAKIEGEIVVAEYRQIIAARIAAIEAGTDTPAYSESSKPLHIVPEYNAPPPNNNPVRHNLHTEVRPYEGGGHQVGHTMVQSVDDGFITERALTNDGESVTLRFRQ